MSKEFLGDRKHALEDAFFVQQDEALLRRLKEADAAKSKKEALSAASGITDDALVQKLVDLGVDSAAVAALSLLPVVLVAWADGEIDAKERAAALQAAAQAGVEQGGSAYQLLERWLTMRPPPQLLATWTDYIRAISTTLSVEARHDLKLGLLGRARAVAEAAGGFMGAGWKTSPAEKDVLSKLEKAFST